MSVVGHYRHFLKMWILFSFLFLQFANREVSHCLKCTVTFLLTHYLKMLHVNSYIQDLKIWSKKCDAKLQPLQCMQYWKMPWLSDPYLSTGKLAFNTYLPSGSSVCLVDRERWSHFTSMFRSLHSWVPEEL